MSLLGEVKRRKVFQVAAAYAVVAWLLIQVADVVLPTFEAPDWVMQVFTFTLIAGFPVALVLAWAYDITPRGIVRSTPIDDEKEVFRRSDGSSDAAESVYEELPNSIAVLPFENLSPNPDDAYFAAGMHEEILNQLAKIRDISVIARTSVLQYAGAARPIGEIARELRVGKVMEGSVRYAGDRVRVTAQLIDGISGTHLWTETYDRDLADVFSIQTDIATRIAAALEAELSARERETIAEQPTQSTDAYRIYLRAVAQFADAGNLLDPTGLPSLRASIRSYLDRALELDPGFALAHAWKAVLYMASRQHDPIPVGAWADRAAELESLTTRHAQEALAHDPNLGLAHTALGSLHFMNWHAAEAGGAFSLALELSPNDPQVLLWNTLFAYARERFEDAVTLARRAVDLDPNDLLIRCVLGYSLENCGKLDEAAEAYRQAIMLNPAVPVAHVFKSGFELKRGDREVALESIQLADQLMPPETAPSIRAHVAWHYGSLDRRDDARKILREIHAASKQRYVDTGTWAMAYLGVGDYDRALELYEALLTDITVVQDYWVVHYARQNSCADPVVDEPRFQQVFDGLRLTE
jgi:adenylate cyclase